MENSVADWKPVYQAKRCLCGSSEPTVKASRWVRPIHGIFAVVSQCTSVADSCRAVLEFCWQFGRFFRRCDSLQKVLEQVGSRQEIWVVESPCSFPVK